MLTLTNRDLQIILTVYHHDGTTAELLRRRFWPTPGGLKPCYGRLARLIAARYLRAVRLPAESSGGSGKRWLTLGAAALPILRRQLGLTTGEIKRLRHSVVPLFFRHELLARRFQLNVELACESVDFVTIVDWQVERVLKRQPLKVRHPASDTRVDIVPDGAFALSLMGGAERPFYVEIDRGTMLSPRRIMAKWRAYLLATIERPIPVLIVVPDRLRAHQLSQWAERAAEAVNADPRIFWLASQDELDDHSVLFRRVWDVVRGPRIALVPTTSAALPRLTPTDPGQLTFPSQRPPFITYLARADDVGLTAQFDGDLQ